MHACPRPGPSRRLTVLRLDAQYLVFKVNDERTFVVPEEIGEKGASFEEFCAKMPDGECRYGIYDVVINTKSGAQANKLMLIAWCADSPPACVTCLWKAATRVRA